MPLRRSSWHAVLAAAIAATTLLFAGCDSAPTAAPTGAKPGEPVPTYESVAGAYNRRVADLARLSTPVSVVIDAEKDGGAREQLEGNLVVERPLNVALRLDKMGQTAAYLGSNDHAYWWMSVADKEPWVAVGSHIKARPQDAAQFGLPVHPLEFIELIGIMELPGTLPAGAPAKPLVRSADGKSLLLTLPSRWGMRRFTIDPATMRPSRIDLLTAAGVLQAGAELSRYVAVPVDGKPGTNAKLASNVTLTVPENKTRVILVIADPKGPTTVRAKLFDLVPLVKSYDIKRLIDLDKPVAPGAPGKKEP